MIASGTVRNALDLNREEPRTPRPLPGRRAVPDRPPAGRGRRRLRHAGHGGWDTHSSNFKTLRSQLPELDRGVANLIQDLHDRGMDDDVVDGDVGRVRPHAEDQRQRRAAAITGRRSCRRLVAGGGLKMGQAIGSTNARGEYAARPPVHARRRCSARCTGRSASTRRRRSPTAAAGRCTSSTTANRSPSCCNSVVGRARKSEPEAVLEAFGSDHRVSWRRG